MEKEQLGVYVSERRKKLGLRQADLASSLGYTNQAISKFESGDSTLSILLLPDLANLLALSLDDLVERNPAPSPFAGANPKADGEIAKRNLCALREKENLSQRQFAGILGVSARSVLNYENGNTSLSFASLERLLTHFGLKASSFFYEDLSLKAAPLPEEKAGAAPSLPSSRKALWPRALAIGGSGFVLLGILLGATSPLWAKKSEGASLEDSSFSSDLPSSVSSEGASSSPFSSLPSSSSGSSSSEPVSSSSSPVSSSASTSSSDADLTPLLPGLKKFAIAAPNGATSDYLALTGDHVLRLDTGSYSFPANAKDLYEVSPSVEGSGANSLRGFEFASPASSDPFGSLTLQVFQNSIDRSVQKVIFCLIDKTSHSTILKTSVLTVTVYNPAGQDLVKEIPGLKGFSAFFDAKDNLTPLESGYHAFTFKTSPESYFTDVGATYRLKKDAGEPENVSVSGTRLYIPEEEGLEDLMHSLSLEVSLPESAGSLSIPFFVHHSSTTSLSWAIPSLTDFYLRNGALQGIRSGAGTYSLTPVYEMTGSLNESDYSLSFAGLDTLPAGLSLASESLSGPITLIIPDGLRTGSRYRVKATLYRKNDATISVDSRPFLIEIA
jgi:transcriptional regulator with XRE-family HTH domain